VNSAIQVNSGSQTTGAAKNDQAVEHILTQVRQANRILHSLFAAYTKHVGLTLHQTLLLRALGHAEQPLTLGQLADQMDVAKSTASVEVDRMVKDGMLVRETDPECRRQVLITLSPKGRDLAAFGPATVTKRIATRLAKVSPEDLGDIETGLGKLNAILDGLAAEKGWPSPD
jgi:DNA-binding MarR family transcriptional regulator